MLHINLDTPEQLARAQELQDAQPDIYYLSDVSASGANLSNTRLHYAIDGECDDLVAWVLDGIGECPEQEEEDVEHNWASEAQEATYIDYDEQTWYQCDEEEYDSNEP
jgi:hypothetical protein